MQVLYALLHFLETVTSASLDIMCRGLTCESELSMSSSHSLQRSLAISHTLARWLYVCVHERENECACEDGEMCVSVFVCIVKIMCILYTYINCNIIFPHSPITLASLYSTRD